MDERKYYCVCGSNCKYETMTKEQILAAIAQAVETGVVGDVDTGFVTNIKEQNGRYVSFWVGTQAQYNALAEIDANCIYIISNDTSKEDFEKVVAELRAAVIETNSECVSVRKECASVRQEMAAYKTLMNTKYAETLEACEKVVKDNCAETLAACEKAVEEECAATRAVCENKTNTLTVELVNLCCQAVGSDGGYDGSALVEMTAPDYIGVALNENEHTSTLAFSFANFPANAKICYIGGSPFAYASKFSVNNSAATLKIDVRVGDVVLRYDERSFKASTADLKAIFAGLGNIVAFLGRPLTNADTLEVIFKVVRNDGITSENAFTGITTQAVTLRYLGV